MASKMLTELIEQTRSLSKDDQLRLALELLQRAIKTYPPLSSSATTTRKYRRWQEIRGLAYPSLMDEDAQTWVSRTRREADTCRDWSIT